jgi:hypothetical protein
MERIILLNWSMVIKINNESPLACFMASPISTNLDEDVIFEGY